MKPKLLLLSVCFVLFYLFTDFNWQMGQYLSQHKMYLFLQSKRGLINEGSDILSFLLYALIGYLNFYLLFYQRKLKVISVLVYVALAMPLMILCRYLLQEVIVYHIAGFHNYSDDMLKPLRYLLDNIYLSIYYGAFGFIFFLIQLSAYNQKTQNELVLQNRMAELAFLRSQINPHFLFNSLNNVYTLVYQESKNALPSISKLSELLRYMLYEKADFVPLTKEVQYLNNFIDLQLMRYNFQTATRLNIQVPAKSLQIAPLTLIPFVENAFKHGSLNDEKQPLSIELSVNDKRLYFKVNNKKNNLNKDETGGIGLSNVKKRLALIYGKEHELNISETDDLYIVELFINLQNGT